MSTQAYNEPRKFEACDFGLSGSKAMKGSKNGNAAIGPCSTPRGALDPAAS
jgi:hypothetical protein